MILDDLGGVLKRRRAAQADLAAVGVQECNRGAQDLGKEFGERALAQEVRGQLVQADEVLPFEAGKIRSREGRGRGKGEGVQA